MIRRSVTMTYKLARGNVVALVGATVLLLGVVMLVTPGPAFVVIPLGLAILSIEFAWARYWLRKVRETISAGGRNARGRQAERHRARAEAETGQLKKQDKKKAPES